MLRSPQSRDTFLREQEGAFCSRRAQPELSPAAPLPGSAPRCLWPPPPPRPRPRAAPSWPRCPLGSGPGSLSAVPPPAPDSVHRGREGGREGGRAPAPPPLGPGPQSATARSQVRCPPGARARPRRVPKPPAPHLHHPPCSPDSLTRPAFFPENGYGIGSPSAEPDQPRESTCPRPPPSSSSPRGCRCASRRCKSGQSSGSQKSRQPGPGHSSPCMGLVPFTEPLCSEALHRALPKNCFPTQNPVPGLMLLCRPPSLGPHLSISIPLS